MLYRVELIRDRLVRLPVSKEQSRAIDVVESTVFEDVMMSDCIVLPLANMLRSDIQYRIVKLGELPK